MSSPSFSIESSDNLIRVTLAGDWNVATELQYLNELSQVMRSKRCGSWGMLVDMRLWHFVANTASQTANIRLDRRNQLAECWIVADLHQAKELKTLLPSRVRHFCTDNEEVAGQWLQGVGFACEPA